MTFRQDAVIIVLINILMKNSSVGERRKDTLFTIQIKGEEKMPKIFISHSTKDQSIAEKICDILEEKEHFCWISPGISAAARSGRAGLP